MISSFFLLKDFFYESLFVIQYIPRNTIMAIILANTYTTGYDLIDKKFAKTVCQNLKIEP